MANSDTDSINAELYQALIDKDEQRVLHLYKLYAEEDGPMRVVTIHKDTILHVALYSMQVQLVINLMKNLSSQHIDLMEHRNSGGNTVLHEAATYDKLLPAAKMMLKLQPKLLTTRNNNKENPLFRAARYGQMKTFKFLDACILKNKKEEDIKKSHKKFDGSTILHAAIAAEHFDLAIWIARKHDYLLDFTDGDGLTALQVLACNPEAFQYRGEGLSMTLIDSGVDDHDDDDDDDDSSHLHEEVSSYRVPWWDEMVDRRKKYNAAINLAYLLIPKDMSWKITKSIVDQRETDEIDEKQTESKKKSEKEISAEKKKAEKQQTPLLLATQTGCLEIVEKILEVHPQAIEHINEDGRCILHIAIKYRQMKIFEMVQRMEVPMRRLIQKCDARGNSILHMVGKKVVNETVQQTEKRSPSFQLQDDLLLFERLKKVIRPHFHKHTNKDGETAEELFSVHKEELRDRSQEWLKRTAENCSIVAVLIATVAFAAAYTIPGGSKDDGSPVFLNQTFFVIFTISDVLSLTFCLTAVIIFLSILTSSFRLNDFKQSLPQKLMLGISCLILSVSMMMLAFAATVILMIRHNEHWTRIALYLVAFLPVTVFASIYMPLYISLLGTFRFTLIHIWKFCPRFTCQSSEKSLLEVDENEAKKLQANITTGHTTEGASSIV